MLQAVGPLLVLLLATRVFKRSVSRERKVRPRVVRPECFALFGSTRYVVGCFSVVVFRGESHACIAGEASSFLLYLLQTGHYQMQKA